jgi:xanthine dehydrogenase accessory factor
MKEIRAIVNAYDQAVKEGKQTALLTVVQLEGSSYRRPGARMLVTEDGQLTGAISGGCLEGDALQKALLVLHLQEPRIVTYDTSEEDEAGMGAQLGCAGIIQVLIEPIQSNQPDNPIELLRKGIQRRQAFAVATVFCLDHKQGSHWGTCGLLDETGANFPDLVWRDWLHNNAIIALQSRRSAWTTHSSDDKKWTCFIEYVPAPISLWVIGAGNDVIPLVTMAQTLGWDTTVIDGRPALANIDRFQSGCQVIVSRPEQALSRLKPDPRTAVALMTHNYHYDKAMLKVLLDTPVAYIGLLGPRKKRDRMLEELKAEGTLIAPEQLDRLYGPIGLDIGAETSEEIALSILAEIQAVMTGGNGLSLRNKTTVIHDRNCQLA